MLNAAPFQAAAGAPAVYCKTKLSGHRQRLVRERGMTDDTHDDVARSRAKVQQRFPQFVEFLEAQNELVRSGTCLLTGDSYENDYRQYLRLVGHVEQIWDASVLLLAAGLPAQAMFLAITCIEETGKVGVARFQLALREVARHNGHHLPSSFNVGRRGSPFYSHPQKHLLAAGAGAIVNSRLDRIVGLQRVVGFLDCIKAGSLEALRQSCLYADIGSEGPRVPGERIDRSETIFYTVIAGELMAEVLGLEAAEWERLVAKVQAFERAEGQSWE